MIITLKQAATDDEVKAVSDKVFEYGYRPHLLRCEEGIRIAAVGPARDLQKLQTLSDAPGVDSVVQLREAYELVSREFKQQKTLVRTGDLEIGGPEFIVMAGPCSVETRDQLAETAEAVWRAGAKVLRAGAYKPRTSPYEFQGLEVEGLRLLAEIRDYTGLKIITEVITPEDVGLVAEYADILQVGARNMQNFALLKKLGQIEKPVLLKRGMYSTLREFLLAAQYIAAHGNGQIVLCERGIRTFEDSMRNTLDLAAVPMLKGLTHLPVVVDPSHGTGHRRLIRPTSKGALAVGADGLIIEVHRRPDEAWSDGKQSITPQEFAEIMNELRAYAHLESLYIDSPHDEDLLPDHRSRGGQANRARSCDQPEANLYKVIVNKKQEYTIWPVGQEIPHGYMDSGMSGLESTCLAYIKEVITLWAV